VKQFLLCSLLIIAAASALQARPAPVVPQPADHSIEQALPVNLFADSAKAEADEPKPAEVAIVNESGDAYELAYEAAQTSGKMAVFICMEGCRPCKPAKEEFQKLSASVGYPCVMLDYNLHRAKCEQILGETFAVPALVIFERRDDERWWQVDYAGSPEVLRSVMQPVSNGAASFGPECLCEKCPDNCPANGCNCSASAGDHNAGSCGPCCRKPLRNAVKWVADHKPVRKAVAGVVVGSCRVLKAAAWCVTHPCGGKFRRGCR